MTGVAFAELINSNTISGTIHFSGTSNGIRFHDGNAVMNLTGALRFVG